MSTNARLKKLMIAAWVMVIAGFGMALVAYARSIPPEVHLGTGLVVYLVSRLAAFLIVMALLHVGLMRCIHGLRGLRASRSSGLISLLTGALMIVIALAALAFTLMISFPQY